MSNKKNKGGLSIEAACEGGGVVAIALTATEVAQAKSILARLGCTQLYVMKRDAKSAAMFYAVESAAMHAQQTYDIDYLMTVEAEKFASAPDAPKAPEAPKESQING
ncbi:MAG: hypothetical protein SNG97_06305 [Rikenellaceae bacterium]